VRTQAFCPARKIGNLVTACPALVRMNRKGRTSQLKQGEAVQKIMDLFLSEQVVILSGQNRKRFAINTRAGKTHLVKHELAPLLKQQGRSFCLLDLGDLMGRRTFASHLGLDLDLFNKRIDSLPEKGAEFYIFDEIHRVFPFSLGVFNVQEAELVSRHNNTVSHFWRQIETLLADGKKILFVSAWNPQDINSAKMHLYDKANLPFLTAPLVELFPSSWNWLWPLVYRFIS